MIATCTLFVPSLIDVDGVLMLMNPMLVGDDADVVTAVDVNCDMSSANLYFGVATMNVILDAALANVGNTDGSHQFEPVPVGNKNVHTTLPIEPATAAPAEMLNVADAGLTIVMGPTLLREGEGEGERKHGRNGQY